MLRKSLSSQTRKKARKASRIVRSRKIGLREPKGNGLSLDKRIRKLARLSRRARRERHPKKPGKCHSRRRMLRKSLSSQTRKKSRKVSRLGGSRKIRLRVPKGNSLKRIRKAARSRPMGMRLITPMLSLDNLGKKMVVSVRRAQNRRTSLRNPGNGMDRKKTRVKATGGRKIILHNRKPPAPKDSPGNGILMLAIGTGMTRDLPVKIKRPGRNMTGRKIHKMRMIFLRKRTNRGKTTRTSNRGDGMAVNTKIPHRRSQQKRESLRRKGRNRKRPLRIMGLQKIMMGGITIEKDRSVRWKRIA